MTEPSDHSESNDSGKGAEGQGSSGITPIDLAPQREVASAPSLRATRIRALGLTISAPLAAFIFALAVVIIVVLAAGFQVGVVLDSVSLTMNKG